MDSTHFMNLITNVTDSLQWLAYYECVNSTDTSAIRRHEADKREALLALRDMIDLELNIVQGERG